MLKFPQTSLLSGLLICAASLSMAQAQTVEIDADEAQSRLNRVVEPVSYWVGAETLHVRDNPVAGRIVETMEYGQKILSYSQYENWVQISEPGAKQRWVNSDFLSNSSINRVSYTRNVATRTSDVVSVRIKDPENRKSRVFGVRLKTAATGNALITTSHDTQQGAFFQNHFVSCNNQRPVGIRLVGEGYSFLDAQDDVRGAEFDIFDTQKVEGNIDNSLDKAISSFACKAQEF